MNPPGRYPALVSLLRPFWRDWVGVAVAGAAVDERAAAGGPRQAGGEVAPGRDAAQTFVQEDEGERRAGGGAVTLVFEEVSARL